LPVVDPPVWSQQTHVRFGDDDKFPFGFQRRAFGAPPRSSVIRSLFMAEW
jgi:hypothetical protein